MSRHAARDSEEVRRAKVNGRRRLIFVVGFLLIATVTAVLMAVAPSPWGALGLPLGTVAMLMLVRWVLADGDA